MAGWIAVAALCAWSLTLEGQKPAVPDVLKAAADYLVQYSEKLSVVAADEEYIQREPMIASSSRRLQADFVLLGAAQGSVNAFRDVYARDGHKVRDRDDRLLQLLTPASDASQQQALAISADAVRHYLSPNFRVLDMPTVALDFLRTDSQQHSQFSLDSLKTMGGVQVAVLRMKGGASNSVLPLPEGIGVSGKFWVETVTGAVRQTELTLSGKGVMVLMATKYEMDPGLALLVPIEMDQRLELSAAGTGALSNMGAGGFIGGRQSLEGRARYTKFRRVRS